MSEEKEKTLFVRVPESYHDRVVELAKKLHMKTYTNYIKSLLKAEFEKYEKDWQPTE